MQILKQEEQLLVFQSTENMEVNPNFFDDNPTEKVAHFHEWVYKLHNGGFTFMEAIINFCDIHDVEYEYVNKIISPQLKIDLEQECVSLNIMKPKNANVAPELF